MTAACIGCSGSRSQRSDRRERREPDVARAIAERRVTSAASRPSIPSRVHNACSRVRGAAATRPPASSAPRPRRLVVALDQQTAARYRATSRSDATAPGRGAPASRTTTMAAGPDGSCRARRGQMRPRPDRLFELSREDLIAQILGDVAAVLDDAAIHVDDVERAVGRRRQVHGPETLVGRGDEFAAFGRPFVPRSVVPVVGDDDPADEIARPARRRRRCRTTPPAADRRGRRSARNGREARAALPSGRSTPA